jgi:hypothetical protein
LGNFRHPCRRVSFRNLQTASAMIFAGGKPRSISRFTAPEACFSA